MFTRSLISVTAMAMVSGVAMPSGGVLPLGEHDMRNTSQGWYEETAAESLRQDQCLMTEVLRMGGPSMAGVAQDALNQEPEALHTLADPDYWNGTPLSEAFSEDQDTADSALQGLHAKVEEWKEPLAGLQTPGGFTDTDFHWPPGTSDGKKDFYEQTGLSKWVSARFWQDEDSFYEDPTPQADETVRQAVMSQGDALYADEADPSLPPAEWNRAYDEHQAYDYLLNWSLEPTGADNARIFLTYGGFPRTGPQQGTATYRIAVEDMKSRFATCAWRDPIDPDDALNDVVATAASEWQSEVASQALQRNQILDANVTATKALASGAETLGDMLGNSWAADHLVRWQAYWSPGGPGDDEAFPPSDADFDQAEQELSEAQDRIAEELSDLRALSDKAEQAAETTDQAQQAAYEIADASGAPRGRGLLVGQQKAQVTHGTAAALKAMVTAGETALAATHASAADSETVAQRAVAQAAQSKAEFRKEAAHLAEVQAQAAADAAKAHRDEAKADKETAESRLTDALNAEADAKAAAADAHAKRLAAEAEEQTAKEQKAVAAAKQAEAAEHKQNAQAYQATAETAEQDAESAAATAHQKRADAEAARDDAKAKQEDAWDAAQQADVARAKADAKDAYADAHSADADAEEARAAADAADGAADRAESAAASAQSEAEAASQAAADADAAATRAEAAASRARADADAAEADKVKADAAVKTATSSAADAIQASKDSASEARAAVQLADEAEQKAKDARADADAAKAETVKARAAAAKAAGFAHVTAQSAVDAREAAAKVADPANDAIELGSPYRTTDAAAGLVVLTGQASKTIAEQQVAVADAHVTSAQEEATQAQDLADQAANDTKAAYQSSANAAASAAEARGYAQQALEYSASAAEAAAEAAASRARTVDYDSQAAADAAAADTAADNAEGYAQAARDSADEAALDAEAAHQAAAAAQQAAENARDAAEQADADATAAEEAAKDAQRYAESAQDAVDEAERQAANQQVSAGAGTGIGGVFYVVDQSKSKIVSATQIGVCPSNAPLVGCDASYELQVDVLADFYMCTDDEALATAEGCPKSAWYYLKTERFSDQSIQWNHHFSGEDVLRIGWSNLFGETLGGILYEIILGDFVDCLHGSASSCAWTAAMFVPVGKALGAIADSVRALDAAARTGIGFTDAWKGLRALNVSADVLAGAAYRSVDKLIASCTAGAATGLKAMAATAAGDACKGIVAYNTTVLGKKAYAARKRLNVGWKRNVAVAHLPGWGDNVTGDYVVAASGDGMHAEESIIAQIKAKGHDPKEITELYTDRKPCPKLCRPLLADELKEGTPVSWAVPYGEYSEVNKQAARKLRKMIEQADQGN